MEQVYFSQEKGEQEPLLCRWCDCNQSFSSHSSLATHLSEEHVGWKKGDYFCEWTNCSRRGTKSHNRFALMMHLRIHTGEKPFECNYSDCGQTFGRMDALTRHKKAEHGVEQLLNTPNNYPSPIPTSTLKLNMKRAINKKSLSEPKAKKTKTFTKYTLDYISSDGNHDYSEEREPSDSIDVESKISNKLLLDTTSDYSQYRLAKAQLNYLLRENGMLQDECDNAIMKLKRLRTERRVLLDSVMIYDQQDELEIQ